MKPRVATVVGLAIGSMLLSATNCHFEKRAINSPAAKQLGGEVVADNSACYVCHINYDGEQLTLDHELAGIGCAQCHGRSYSHCSDESNVTPPDIMYPKAKVNPSCMVCHPRDDIIDEGAHRAFLFGVPAAKKYCTDCHGKRHHWQSAPCDGTRRPVNC